MAAETATTAGVAEATTENDTSGDAPVEGDTEEGPHASA
jgi:hypothetical protein